jgi:glutaredoxin-like YruB-family protein
MDTQDTTQGATQVTIYSTPTCHFCHMAKDFFAEKGVTYQDFNVLEDTTKREEMMEMTGQMGVPVIRIGDDVVVGFDRPMIEKLLGLAS